MKRVIHLLQVEDSAEDAELVVRLLERAGCEIRAQRVENEAQMRAALAGGLWDLIIADYRLPQFSAPEALEVYQSSGLDIPFLVVSGAVGEDVAVGVMKAGAHDYLLKHRLDRLPPAVERELQEAALRQEKRSAESKLRAAYSELEAIYASAPVLMFVIDEQLRVEKINEMAAGFCGRPPERCTGRAICELLLCERAAERLRRSEAVEPCRNCPLSRSILKSMEGHGDSDPVEISSPLPLGDRDRPSYLLASIAPILIPGQRRSVLVCAQDLTLRKRAENSLSETVDSLRAALAQNRVLFQEVHHRVKNNLQIVASLLSMKARKPAALLGAEDLKDCERRIRSMSLIHELLYSQKDMQRLDFAQYASRIAADLVSSYEASGSMALRLDLEPVDLSIDQAIPCGLILNELVTNAVKYAYPDRKGEIRLAVSVQEDLVTMTVADDGVGLTPGAPTPETSLGMQIVQMLAKQLKADMEHSSPPGLAVTLRFARVL